MRRKAGGGDVPEEVGRLAAEREELRRAGDFDGADAIRDRIRELGFAVTDTSSGPRLEAIVAEVRRVAPRDVRSLLDQPPIHDVSVQWVAQGWPQDVIRGLESFHRYQGSRIVQHVVVDAAGTDPALWPGWAEVISLQRDFGWAAGCNAGLRRATGRIVVVVDGSLEAAGDVLGPLVEALADPSVGVAGPFGIVTEDLHDFRSSEGPDVDAIEGYLMAFRRDVLASAGLFDEKFRFYRTADIECSFRIKDRGFRAVVVPVPVVLHEHRMWTNTSPEERDRLSKRNYYRFLDRFRGRTDLTEAGRASS